MELLEGRSFAELRSEAAERGQRVPLGITLRVLTDACRGLDAAHRAVDDAGPAAAHRPPRLHPGQHPRRRERRGEGHRLRHRQGGDAGRGHRARRRSRASSSTCRPEMIAGKPVDHRADIFAAGVMLYEQLCGRRPFTGLTHRTRCSIRIAEGQPQPPARVRPLGARARSSTSASRALAREPPERFSDLDEFIDAIESVGGSAELAATPALSAYLAQLFPASDPKSKALRRALERGSRPPAGAGLRCARGAAGLRPGAGLRRACGAAARAPGPRPGAGPRRARGGAAGPGEAAGRGGEGPVRQARAAPAPGVEGARGGRRRGGGGGRR